MKIYHVSVSKCEVHTMGVCALDKIHAGMLANERLKDYGFQPGEYSIDSITIADNDPGTWELGTAMIYN